MSYANGRLPAHVLAPIAGGRLRKDAALRWNAMNFALRARGLPTVLPNGSYSSYRTRAGQVLMRRQWCARGRCGNAAVPGTSNHGLGLAVDANRPDLINRHGAPFGWQKRWSDAAWEPWHFKWAGFGKTTGGRTVPVLRQGSRGKNVVTLKKLLYDKGYRAFSSTRSGQKSSDRSDPYFGKYTRATVIRFQRDHGLRPADGIVGPATWRALRK